MVLQATSFVKEEEFELRAEPMDTEVCHQSRLDVLVHSVGQLVGCCMYIYYCIITSKHFFSSRQGHKLAKTDPNSIMLCIDIHTRNNKHTRAASD